MAPQVSQEACCASSKRPGAKGSSATVAGRKFQTVNFQLPYFATSRFWKTKWQEVVMAQPTM